MQAPVAPIGFFVPGWPLEEAPNGVVSYVAAVRTGLATLGVASAVVVPRRARPGEADVLGADPNWTWLERLGKSARLKLGLAVGFPAPLVRELLVQLAPAVQGGLRVLEMEESFGMIDRLALPGLKRVVRLHGPWFLNGLALGATLDHEYSTRVALEGRAIERADAVTSPSQDVLDQVRAHYRLALPNARVIPNPGPHVPSEEAWNLEASRPKQLVFVGRFDRHKGGDLVIRAFAQLAARDPELELVFAGPDRGLSDEFGGAPRSLQEYVQEHVPEALRSRLLLLGHTLPSRLAELRRQSRVCIVASRYETFGMTALEALACGCPIVAPAVGGIREIIQHERTGLLFPPTDVDAMVAHIERLLQDPGLATDLAASARAAFVARFRPEVVAKATLDLYEEIVQAPLAVRQ